MSVLALLRAPGTAVAQDAPYVTGVSLSGNRLTITFNENLVGSDDLTQGLNTGQVRVTVNGFPQAISQIWADQHVRTLSVHLVTAPSAGAVVKVFYDQDVHSHRLRNGFNQVLESFGWDVTNAKQIPIEKDVYELLEDYFSGTGTLSDVETALQASGKTYYEKLSEEVVSGRLDRRFDTDERSVVGTDGASGWHQVGTPSVRPGPSDTCGGTTVPGGEGGFETHVSSRYYWNCTQDGQWVPVKVPRARCRLRR